MTSLFKQLNGQNSLPNNVQQMAQMFKTITNPQKAVTEIMNKNPQIASMIQAANGNPEAAFRNLAKQMNVDADQIIKMLQ